MRCNDPWMHILPTCVDLLESDSMFQCNKANWIEYTVTPLCFYQIKLCNLADKRCWFDKIVPGLNQNATFQSRQETFEVYSIKFTGRE